MNRGELYLYPKDPSIENSWDSFVIKTTELQRYYWDFEVIAGTTNHIIANNFAEGSAFAKCLIKITQNSQRLVVELIFKGRQ